MTSGFLAFLAAVFVVAGVALIFTPLPSWAHWAGCGLCVLSIYCGWRQ